MRKIYKGLTNDQKARGIIFSSCLKGSSDSFCTNGTIHEVKDVDIDKHIVIERLLNDKFFKNSPWKYNEIRR